MALSFLDNVDYRGKKPNFTRDLFDTIADMAAFNENYLPDVFLTCNKETGKPYVYNRNNENDTTFGKWRPLQGESGSADWDSLIGKPFSDIDGTVFIVNDGVLSIEIPIEKITVNGEEVAPIDKTVNIDIPEFEQLTTEDILDMIGLSQEELDTLSTIIADTEVRIDKTYSSSKIVADITQCLVDSKTYTLEQIANAATASYKVVASTDEVTELRFIYLIEDGDTYNLYILEEDTNEVVRIGTTKIDLSDYYTKEEVNNTFVLNTVFDLLSQSIGDVANLTTEAKIIVDAINEVSGAATAISESVTTLTEQVTEMAETVATLEDIDERFDSKLDAVQPEEHAGKFLVVADDGRVTYAEPSAASGDSAENIAYINADYAQYSNVDLALDALFAKVYYVKPSCSLSASPAGGTFEMGKVISAPITFSWTTNKPVTSQTLTDCVLDDNTVRTATYETDISTNKTFTLSVSDGENSATSSVSYSFMNNVFWGSAPIGTYDSAFINTLSNKKLTTSVKGTYSFNIAAGEYGYWAVPSNMSISSVWIGGFEVTLEDCGTVYYTNSKNYTTEYRIYKTGQSGLGSISAEIK